MGLGFTTLSFCALSLVTEGEARRYYLMAVEIRPRFENRNVDLVEIEVLSRVSD